MLQRIAQAYCAPVVAISSLNRSSYFNEVALDSMKESGGIEYGCDLLLGMQPANLASQAQEIKQAGEATSIEAAARKAMHMTKCAPVRDVELTVLKNRNGAMPPSVRLDFLPAANTFIDVVADPIAHVSAMKLLDDAAAPDAQSAPGAWGAGFPPAAQVA